MINGFITIRFLDVLDILLVAFLLYQIYLLIRGTVAIKIFIGIFLIYLFWLFVRTLKMELISEIIGQFMGVGVIALIVVFHQEIRQFLLIVGNKYTENNKINILKSSRFHSGFSTVSVDKICTAAVEMAFSRTGALLVISRENALKVFAEQGVILNADISVPLIKSIFFKDSPLHDGAVILENNKILAAKCILPVTAKTDLPVDYGLRHRSGIGMSEISDTLVIIVSEQTGNISIARSGKIHKITSPERLKKIVFGYLSRTDS